MGKKAIAAGRESECSIRILLAEIRRRMRHPDTNAQQVLSLLKHQERLTKELKAVTAERIRAKLAELDNRSTSQSEVVG